MQRVNLDGVAVEYDGQGAMAPHGTLGTSSQLFVRWLLTFAVGLLVLLVVPAAAQPRSGKLPRLAIVAQQFPVEEISETGANPRYRALFPELRRLGWIDGQTLTVERWSGVGRSLDFAGLAREVVASQPDLILANGNPLVVAMQAATRTIPIVVAGVADPLSWGIVQSLARPEANITGFSVDSGVDIEGKRLELLMEVVPTARRIAYLCSRTTWENPTGKALRDTAAHLGIELFAVLLDSAMDEETYRRMLPEIVRVGAEALYVSNDPENIRNARLIHAFTVQARLPTISAQRQHPEAGGLLSYGDDRAALFRSAAGYVDRILRGAKPGDLPFQQATVLEMIVNLKTAKLLGITLPATIMIRATEVIQ